MSAPKFKNKYRSDTTRAQWWNYGWDSAYFVTICTKNREHYFGKVAKGEMQLSAMGKVAYSCWEEIPNHFPFVWLGEFVVMPNHVHGIVVIDKANDGSGFVGTQNFASQQNQVGPAGNKFGPQSKNLASIIRGFKVGVKKYATMNQLDFIWQPRFHDHIIRDEASFRRIAHYIENNPQKWSEDRFS